MKIKLVQEKLVVEINRRLCIEGGNPHLVLKPGAVASALHSAYYPGDHPFIHGGISEIAGALSYYLNGSHAFEDGNKRTAAQTSLFFLRINDYDVRYPLQPNALARIMEDHADGKVSMDEMKNFYSIHKVPRT